MSRVESPFVQLDRKSWAALADGVKQSLSTEDIAAVRGLGDPLDMEEVRQIYLPLAELISIRIDIATQLHRATDDFLQNPQPNRTPFIIGVAGSVAVGKSTTARLLKLLLSRSNSHKKVELVTTDGFLYSNEELTERGLLNRKGFPESYDRKALLKFVIDVKSGVRSVKAPIYSHLKYNVTGEYLTIDSPDVLIIEGLNVLAPAGAIEGSKLALSDFFDFSVYVDARSRDIRRWYIERFFKLRETAFQNPDSYFHRYAELNDQQALARAEELWNTINWPNLRENILPTRSRATASLRKDENHSIKSIRLRKL